VHLAASGVGGGVGGARESGLHVGRVRRGAAAERRTFKYCLFENDSVEKLSDVAARRVE
jgi:hypothetical protein